MSGVNSSTPPNSPLYSQPDATSADDDAQWLGLLSASSRLVRVTQRRAGHAPGTAQWRVFIYLEQLGPLRPQQIAALENSSLPTASRLLQRLGKEGLVASSADPADGRASLVSLTDAGRNWLDTNRAELVRAIAPLAADLTEEERQVLRRARGLMERIIAADAPADTSTTTETSPKKGVAE